MQLTNGALPQTLSSAEFRSAVKTTDKISGYWVLDAVKDQDKRAILALESDKEISPDRCTLSE